MPWQHNGQMPVWPISCQCKGLQPQWRTAKLQESPAQVNMIKVVVTKNTETIDAFSSHVIPMKAEKVYTRERINVMTQALQAEDRSLPQGLTIQNVYMELKTGSKIAILVVRNSTAYPQTLKKKTLVSRVVTATMVPELLAMINLPGGGEALQSAST